MAEESLKANNRERYRQLQRERKLEPFLDVLHDRLRTACARLVREIEERNPRQPKAFAKQAAHEMLVSDVLKPETHAS